MHTIPLSPRFQSWRLQNRSYSLLSLASIVSEPDRAQRFVNQWLQWLESRRNLLLAERLINSCRDFQIASRSFASIFNSTDCRLMESAVWKSSTAVLAVLVIGPHYANPAWPWERGSTLNTKYRIKQANYTLQLRALVGCTQCLHGLGHPSCWHPGTDTICTAAK